MFHYKVAQPIVPTLLVSHDLMKKLIALLERKSNADDVAYFNRYGEENKTLTLTFYTTAIVWVVSGPDEIIHGCTKTTSSYTSNLLVAEEIAKKLLKDRSINAQVDYYLNRPGLIPSLKESSSLQQRLAPNYLRLQRLGDPKLFVLNIQCY